MCMLRSMQNVPAEMKYQEILAGIGQLYEDAQQVQIEAYWKIARRLGSLFCSLLFDISRCSGMFL